VERGERRLEQQTDGDERQAGVEQHLAAYRVGDGGVHLAELDAAGEAVDQGHAEQEERRRVRAEQEVLEGRLLAQQATPAGQRTHQVQRQRQHLERHEHGQ